MENKVKHVRTCHHLLAISCCETLLFVAESHAVTKSKTVAFETHGGGPTTICGAVMCSNVLGRWTT